MNGVYAAWCSVFDVLQPSYMKQTALLIQHGCLQKEQDLEVPDYEIIIIER